MTKDGRPSLINDIRLFAGDARSYLKGHEDAVAYGRRIAWWLNGEGLSLGAFPALYVFFTPKLKPGAVLVTDQGGEWWHRYVHVGVRAAFPDIPNATEAAMDGILGALLALRMDQEGLIRRADACVREHRDGLRFLLKRHETTKVMTEISFNISVWPKPSYLYVGQTDKITGVYCEADPIALGWYMEAFDLFCGIRRQNVVNLKASRPPMLSRLVKRRR